MSESSKKYQTKTSNTILRIVKLSSLVKQDLSWILSMEYTFIVITYRSTLVLVKKINEYMHVQLKHNFHASIHYFLKICDCYFFVIPSLEALIFTIFSYQPLKNDSAQNINVIFINNQILFAEMYS